MTIRRTILERTLVRLYPTSFRRDYENDLVTYLRDSLADARAPGGLTRFRKTIGVVTDFAATGVLERLTALGRAVRSSGSTKHRNGAIEFMKSGQHLRYAARSLLRSPIYSVVAVLTLALGVGAGASIFAVVDTVLLRPLPYPEPAKIVTLWEQDLEQGPDELTVSPPNFANWAREAGTLTGVSAVVGESFVLQSSGVPTNVLGRKVTPGFFSVFRTLPVLGRTFTEADVGPGAPPVVIISHGFWQRWFGGDPGAVDSEIEMSGIRRRVVGVLPRSFEYGGGLDLWVPLDIPDEQFQADYREARYLTVVGRLQTDATVWQAQQELSRMVRSARGEEAERRWGAVVEPLQANMVGDVAGLLWLILGAVGVVVVVVCANLTNLGIARGTARTGETAVRLAIGASRVRLFAETLTENLLLCTVGGLSGLLLAAWAVGPLVNLAPISIPRLDEVGVSWAVGGFVLALALLIGLVMSVVTSIRVDHANPALVLRGETGATSPHQRLRSGLIISEIALSVALLVTSGLVTKSFLRLSDVDPGFVPRGVATVGFSLPDNRFPTDESKLSFYRNLLGSLSVSPGFETVAFSTNLPLVGSNMNFGFNLEAEEDEARGNRVSEFHTVSVDYFEALGIPIVRGSGFSQGDVEGELGPIVINETFARRYFPGRDPISKKIRIFTDDGYTWRTIIGVVGDLLHGGLATAPREEVYVPMPALIWGFNNLVIKSSLPSAEITDRVRHAVAAIDPGLPVDPATPFSDYVGVFLAPLRFQSTLFGLFAASAVILSAIGLYGLISYVVGARRKEFGIRIALGARWHEVLLLVMKQGMLLTLAGLALGAVVSVGASRLISGMLFDVGRSDTTVFATAFMGIGAVAAVATLAPSLRATRVDPLDALSAE